MTWAEFVARVDEQLQALALDRQVVDLASIAWDADSFGGSVPDVYVQVTEEGGLQIGED